MAACTVAAAMCQPQIGVVRSAAIDSRRYVIERREVLGGLQTQARNLHRLATDPTETALFLE